MRTMSLKMRQFLGSSFSLSLGLDSSGAYSRNSFKIVCFLALVRSKFCTSTAIAVSRCNFSTHLRPVVELVLGEVDLWNLRVSRKHVVVSYLTYPIKETMLYEDI